MNFKSISFKLVFTGCLAVLIPLTINGVLSVAKSSKSLAEIAKENSTATAIDIANLVSKALEDEKKIVAAFASGQLVKDTTAKVNRVGIEQAQSEIAPLRLQMKSKYKLLGDKYLGIFVTNDEGILYTGELASGKEYKGSNISSRGYFQQAKTTKQPVVGEVVKSKSTGKLIVVACAPILSENGVFLGTFGMSLKASALTDLVQTRKIGTTGYAFMANKEGIIIAHPKGDLVLTLDLKTLDGMKSITSEMLASTTGVQEYTFNGIDKIAGYAPVQAKQWSIATTQDRSEFLAAATSIRNNTIIVTLLSIIVAGIAIFITAKTITRPINQAVTNLKDIAEGEGDLTMRLNVTSKDEVGELAKWFNIFIDKLQNIIKQIAENTLNVTTSSGTLSDISKDLLRNADDTSSRATNVAASSEEMSTNLSSVAAAMEESATNANMVAVAAEEMSATINEIAESAEKARGVSLDAVKQAEEASENMNELGSAANKIGRMTETITDISEQTNLLALNATIEAARAGEAGKGFAVVANEIKELAKQTAEATLEIKNLVEAVQSTSDKTEKGISSISEVIVDVNETVGSIATAVEEQTATTREIAENIAQASQGIQEVNENVSQSSSVASEITQDIAEVSTAAQNISESSQQVEDNARELQESATHLNHIVGNFKV
ncbi:methyl-accepting chemotaxis protein [Desulfogranum marinum]|uniref:methyl-accepting chemotaxis protein n=1 Tax=Desulfogranum marinum TaxID=453220 RepID=UPI0019668805|nr:methyl-accepting chemotaxis protein [Desulfogranum marinum]MBM9510953.1 methyl-accepting chemotaxis protein [Desulfogranum marinum]